MNRLPALALAALLAPVPVHADWEVLRKNDSVTLAIEPTPIKKAGDVTSFHYLLDHAKVQTDFKAGLSYSSMIVRAQARCATRMLALGNTDVYSERSGKGA